MTYCFFIKSFNTVTKFNFRACVFIKDLKRTIIKKYYSSSDKSLESYIVRHNKTLKCKKKSLQNFHSSTLNVLKFLLLQTNIFLF